MLIKTKKLKGFALQSLDGEIGKVKEFYFDDRHWTIRYLVADTGIWLPGRQVLISPYALGAVTKSEEHISVHLTKKQIEESPSLDSDKPVSRQFEESYFSYYDWPEYWDGPFSWGAYPRISVDNLKMRTDQSRKNKLDSHLRSTHTVSGYHIQAADGEIGHVDDFIVDDDSWTIRYLVIDTKNWWAGKKVLITPRCIENVSWDESKVFVKLSRESIKKAPEYTDWSLLTREFEIILHNHYAHKGYWDTESDNTAEAPDKEK